MSMRRPLKQSLTFQERLASFAEAARAKASQLPPGPERDDMLQKASQAETAAHLDQWANSPGLQPPE